MDPKTMAMEDVIKIEEEIKELYKNRKGLGIFAVILLLIGLALIPVSFIVVLNTHDSSLFATFGYLIAMFISGFFILMIVRSAVFNKRIRSRKILVQEARHYQELKREFGREK